MRFVPTAFLLLLLASLIVAPPSMGAAPLCELPERGGCSMSESADGAELHAIRGDTPRAGTDLGPGVQVPTTPALPAPVDGTVARPHWRAPRAQVHRLHLQHCVFLR